MDDDLRRPRPAPDPLPAPGSDAFHDGRGQLAAQARPRLDSTHRSGMATPLPEASDRHGRKRGVHRTAPAIEE